MQMVFQTIETVSFLFVAHSNSINVTQKNGQGISSVNTFSDRMT